MKSFVSQEKDLDLLWDRDPVEALEGRGNVVTGVGVGERVSSRFLDILEFI